MRGYPGAWKETSPARLHTASPAVWQEVEETVRYTVSLGTAVDIELSEDCSFRLILLGSILHRTDTLSLQCKIEVGRPALEAATFTDPLIGEGRRL